MSRSPRVYCRSCGKTRQIEAPWARAGSGFSQLMEALVVTLCKAMTVSEVARLLTAGPMRIWRILDHYVEAARVQENILQVQTVGLDETAERRGYRYISLFHDLDERRLLFACDGRKAEVGDQVRREEVKRSQYTWLKDADRCSSPISPV